MQYLHTFIALALACATLIAQGPVSIPTTPIQLDAQIYGPSDLALVKSFDRTSYRKAFGVDAPAYDPARRIKTWFDSTQNCDDPDAVAVYKMIGSDRSGAPAVRQLLLSACEASRVNLPGRNEYGVYVIAPTKTVVRSDITIDGVKPADNSIDPSMLSLRSQAEQLRNELGTSEPVNEVVLGGGFRYVYPDDEPRRNWQIGGFNVGQLLKIKFSHGVGRPGRWSWSGDTSNWLWTPDPLPPDGAGDTRPFVPTPVRDLLPNEVLRTTPFGIQIERTDKKATTDREQGRFTEEDRRTLRKILELLEK